MVSEPGYLGNTASMADPNFAIPCYYYQTCPPAIMPPPYAFHPFQPPDYSPPIPPYLYHQPQPPPHTPPTSYTPYTPYTPQPPSYYTPPTSYTSPYLSDSSGIPWYSTNQHEIQARPNPYHPPSNGFTSPFITTTQFPFGVIDEQQPELVVSQVFDESPHSPELIVNSSNDNCHQMYDKFTEIIQKLEEIGKNLADQSRKSKEMSSKKVSQSSHTLTHVPIVSNLDKSAVKSDFEEIDKLEARVVCEDVLESETKDEVSVEKENMSTCEAVSDIYEIDYGTVIAEEVGCVDEAKDEVETNATKLLPPLLHLAFQAFDKFISKLGRFPIATKLQKKLEDAQVFIVGSGASRDPSKKQAPMCTVHSSPHNIDHWLIWARSEFEGLLEKTPTEVDTILSDTSEYTSAIVNAGIFERKDKDAMFSFVEATSKQQDRVRTLFDTGWNTSHQKHIHNDKFEGVVTTYRQVGELFNPPAALKSVFSAAKIERLGNWFNDGSDPRWCCTCLLDATDPLFIEIGKAFIRKIFDPGGQALEVTRRWRDDFWSVMSVAYLICLGAVFGVLRLNRFRKKNKLNMDRYISKILENHEGLTEDYWPLYVVAGAVATVLGWVVVVTWFTSKPDDEVFGSYFDYILEDKNVLKRRHM